MFATDSPEAAGEERNSSVPVNSDGGGGGLWAASVLLLFWLGIREDSESRDHTFLRFMIVLRPTDRVDKKLACVCLRWSNGEEVGDSLARSTGALRKCYLCARERLGMEGLQMLQVGMNALRRKHIIEPFTERNPS